MLFETQVCIKITLLDVYVIIHILSYISLYSYTEIFLLIYTYLGNVTCLFLNLPHSSYLRKRYPLTRSPASKSSNS